MPGSLRFGMLTSIFVACSNSSYAQDEMQPLSAIDWLSRSVERTELTANGSLPGVSIIDPNEPAVSSEVDAHNVTVTALDAPSLDLIGLLAPEFTGLPKSLWSGSSSVELASLVRAERIETLPALRELIATLMLAEADPPFGAADDGQLFLARVDKLLDLGALNEAQALLEAADPTSAETFRRWFDVSLLTGTEAETCTVLRLKPELAPTYLARVFCLARVGQFDTAVLVLNTARALGDITEAEDELLSRFLDPDLFEDEPPLTPPQRTSPLLFRLYDAIGERLSTTNLPRAFAHADLHGTASWRNRMEAAERLARVGAIDPNHLHALYTERAPAASGGVWDRAAAFQRLDFALQDNDVSLAAEALPQAWDEAKRIRIENAFAAMFATRLRDASLPDGVSDTVFLISLLSDDYTDAARTYLPRSLDQLFLIELALDSSAGFTSVPSSPTARAVAEGFSVTPKQTDLTVLADDGKTGEAILRAIELFSESSLGDPRGVTEALILLRHVGLDDIARRAALEYLILDRGV